MILKCDCKTARGIYKGAAGADYQNHKHGHGQRVHNPTKDSAGGRTWRCTVCTTERKAK